MLVLSMNSKRRKRPNVRLGEIGDVPVAFACGFSQKTKENLGHKNYENDVLNPNETAQSYIYGFAMQTSPQFVVLGPGNRENKNPNSAKLAFELVSSDEVETTKLKLNFGTITKKWTSNVFGSVWSYKLIPEFSNGNSNECSYPANGLKDFSDHETLATSKKACEFDTYEHDTRQHDNFNELWQEDTCNEVNNVSPISNHMWDGMMSRGGDVNTVTRWLEEQGFGKYAGVFEMHEVDEEALPLLNLEDLKEIGVFAVGSRRKLYTAIQQLRKRSHFCLSTYSNKDVGNLSSYCYQLFCAAKSQRCMCNFFDS
ncbi:hypothetical protein P3X46_031219 [Hevea brasiliensis]|uniref:SAM domain-containing protein n=1 Tax=Hevea brasiliensis TaxID=3981 RepID=A0ABQ9KKL0_HEVBR|nr:hypothetical protein P3X46_031219 [Hevea brasiliensis]